MLRSLRLWGPAGLVVYDSDARLDGTVQQVGELLQRTDVAMYVAKGRVQGTAVYDHGKDGHSLDRLALLGDLRTALAVGELALVYQPVYDLQLHGGCTSVEALVRWHSPRRGLVSPSAFVPLCEGSGLMRALTRFVLDEALRCASAAPGRTTARRWRWP